MVQKPKRKCAACGSILEVIGSKALCKNPECSGGGVFTLCEFCGDYSLSLKFRYCVNQNCRLYKMRRDVCPICNSQKLITYKGRPICMNPSCISNRKGLSDCFFCGDETFLKVSVAMFCVNPSCAHLLERVVECFHCGQLSFVESAGCCENGDCAFYKVRMVLCKSCGRMTKVAGKDHPQYGRCSNPDCGDYFLQSDRQDEEATTTSSGRRLCGDTVAIPIETLHSASAEQEEIFVGEVKEQGQAQEKSSNDLTPVLRIEVVGDALAWLKDELRRRGLSSVIRVRVEFAEPDDDWADGLDKVK
ncbi:MAG: hypothetical protein DRP63_06465 [Planctomycetota bacterium]|nr:MAG: hypothetical protein DRP63_06465 [Planctomycetota bacterium]